MKHTLLLAALVAIAACSSDDGNQSAIGIAGTSAPMSPLPTAPTAGQTGASAGTPGTAGTGTPRAGTGAAGSNTTGLPVAGMPAPAAGTGAATVAGTGAAGAGAAGSGGTAAGSGGSAANAGSGGAPAGTAGAGPAGSTKGTVTVQFATVSYDGEYAPLNYGAVWFEDGSAKFIKTAKRWAGAAHATDLVAWTKASGGWGSVFGGGGNAADMMDAMSSATIRTHQMHMITWNLQDAQKQLVPDGDYVAKLEMSESRARDRAGPVLTIKFKKGPMPQMVDVPAQEGFMGITLRYMPQ